MNQATTQKVFIAINLIAMPAVGYALYDPIRILLQMRANLDPISLSTGNQYYLLLSIFWWLWAIQWMGLRGRMEIMTRWGNKFLIYWFVGCLVAANVTPFGLRQTLKSAGYKECKDPRQISQASVSRSFVYTFNDCE